MEKDPYSIPGEIWRPTSGEPDMLYCLWLMRHASAKITEDFPEFQYEVAINKDLYQKVFTMIGNYLYNQGFASPDLSSK